MLVSEKTIQSQQILSPFPLLNFQIPNVCNPIDLSQSAFPNSIDDLWSKARIAIQSDIQGTL